MIQTGLRSVINIVPHRYGIKSMSYAGQDTTKENVTKIQRKEKKENKKRTYAPLPAPPLPPKKREKKRKRKQSKKSTGKELLGSNPL